MRIALFQLPDKSLLMIYEKHMESATSCVRITEYVDVDFPPRDPVEVDRLMNACKRARAEQLRAELATLENTI